MTSARLAGLNLHPVKSTATRPVEHADVTLGGLLGDRRWMVVDADRTMVSAREERELLAVVADTPQTDPTQHAALRLAHRRVDGLERVPPLEVHEPDGPPIEVTLHGGRLDAVPAAAEATAWVREVLERHDVTLVWCDDPGRRSLNPAYARPDDHAAFQDGYPLSLVTTASLDRLNGWASEESAARGERGATLAAERFRANLVLDGDLEPFEEDGWAGLRIGAVSLRVVKPIDRCVLTTTDPVSLARGHEPIRSLARHRKWDGKTWFAMHLIPDTVGPVRVGDPVEVTRSPTPTPSPRPDTGS